MVFSPFLMGKSTISTGSFFRLLCKKLPDLGLSFGLHLLTFHPDLGWVETTRDIFFIESHRNTVHPNPLKKKPPKLSILWATHTALEITHFGYVNQ